MHNCKLTRNALIDQTLGETSTGQAREVLAELNDCPACRAEYAALRNTLRVSHQALSSASPAEDFWPGYHARLSNKLAQHQREGLEQPAPAFQSMKLPLGYRLLNGVRRFATTSVRVPVPVALAIVLLVGILSYSARSFSRGSANVTLSSQVANVESPTIQVPVIQERVVMRTVYVERKAHRSAGALPVRTDLTAAGIKPRSEASGKTAMSLVGFKPTEQVKLTVIKGSYQDEK